MEFWRRPWAEREAAFATLRRERPISHYDEPVIEGSAIEFPRGDGLLRAHAPPRRRRPRRAIPRSSSRDPGRSRMMDLPPEMVEYFSGMISTDNPKHARLRRIVSNAFNPRNVRAVEDSIERMADEIIDRARRERHGRLRHRRRGAASPRDHLRHDGRAAERVRDGAAIARTSSSPTATPSSSPRAQDPILAVLEAGAALTGIMEELGKYRVDNPIDDITSALVNAEIESEKLTAAGAGVVLRAARHRRQRDHAHRHRPRSARPQRAPRPEGATRSRTTRASPRPQPTRSCAGPRR